MLWILAWGVLVPLMLGGCFVRSSGSAARLAEAPRFPPPEAWPARDVAALAPIRDAATGRVPLVVDAALPEGAQPRPQTPYAATVRAEIGTIILSSEVFGNVLIRELDARPLVKASAKTSSFMRLHDGDLTAEEQVLGFLPTARAISSRTLLHPRNVDIRAERGARRERVNAALASLGAAYRVNAITDELCLEDGIGLRIPVASQAPDPKAGDRSWRGVLLHMHSLMGNSYERRVMDHLRNDGWMVVDISTQTAITPSPNLDDVAHARMLREALHARAHQLDMQFALLAETVPAGQMDAADFLLLASQTSERLDEYAFRRSVNLRGMAPMQYSSPARRFNQTPQVREFNAIKNATIKDLEELEGAYLVPKGADAKALDAIGAQVARDVDEALAGNAYVVEGVVRLLDARRPALREKPVAIIGFSAGGLATPAVVARIRPILGDRLKAAVLIGAGGNIFNLSQRSTLTDGGLRVRWDVPREQVAPGKERAGEGPSFVKRPKVDKATRDALDAAYLRHAKLDPLVTAPALAGLPVLMLHASHDTWVPAKGGDALWEALGKPERWTIPADHDLLFYFLPGEARAIAAWVRGRAGVR